MNSVVSAAIIEGNLIIGLSDGSVINCGFVQGPQGLTGPQGPMGATGDNGLNGNTIHTIAGTPGNEMGTDGDYAIDNINWRIYGPKAGGVWGKAKEMLPGPENFLENGRSPSGGSGGGSMGGSGSGSGGPAGTVYTNTVQLTNATRTSFSTKSPYKVLPHPGVGRINQEDANNWAFGEVFDLIDEVLPVFVDPNEPTLKYTGRLWFDTADAALYIYDGNVWAPIKLDDAALDGYATEQWTEEKIAEAMLDGAVDLTSYATVAYSDGKDTNLQNQIDELSVTKGKVARYTVKNISGTPVSRPGELATNNPFWSNVVFVSFGIEDLDGVLTKPISTGDIIDFVDTATDKLSRYKVTDATGAPTGVAVEYISGNADFAPDQEKQVYIYPQNEAGASKEYVDAQDLALRDYIDTEIDNLPESDPVPLDDFMTLSGTQIVNPGNWRIQQNASTRGLSSYISIYDDVLGLYHLQEPTQAHHAATKGYVDSINNGPKPAQLSWVYDGTKSSASAPSDGKFYKNDDYLRFSFKTNNGVDLSNGLCNDTGSVLTEFGPIGVIWYYSVADNSWKMKRQFRSQSWRWNYNNHFEFMLSSSKGHAWSSFTENAVYYITVGGWF